MIIEATESREFIERDELREKRKNIKTFDDLVVFLKDIEENYGDGYGEAPRSMAHISLTSMVSRDSRRVL